MQIFWLWLLSIGLAVGLVAAAVRKSSRSALTGYVVLGLSGSIVGGSIARAHSPSSEIGLIAAALAGAIGLIVLIELVGKD